MKSRGAWPAGAGAAGCALLISIGCFTTPAAIAASGHGLRTVTDHHIHIGNPYAMAVDGAAARVLVADSNNHRVVIYDYGGRLVARVKGSATGFAVPPSGGSVYWIRYVAKRSGDVARLVAVQAATGHVAYSARIPRGSTGSAGITFAERRVWGLFNSKLYSFDPRHRARGWTLAQRAIAETASPVELVGTPRGRHLALNDETDPETIKTWRLHGSHARPASEATNRGTTHELAYTPNGALLLAAGENSDQANPTAAEALNAGQVSSVEHTYPISDGPTGIAASPSGRFVAQGCDSAISVTPIHGGQPVATESTRSVWSGMVAFSGRRIIDIEQATNTNAHRWYLRISRVNLTGW